VADRLSGYQRISLDRVEYRGWNTADWEFTWDGRNGQIHVPYAVHADHAQHQH
jgi:hypothetical protein